MTITIEEVEKIKNDIEHTYQGYLLTNFGLNKENYREYDVETDETLPSKPLMIDNINRAIQEIPFFVKRQRNYNFLCDDGTEHFNGLNHMDISVGEFTIAMVYLGFKFKYRTYVFFNCKLL